MVEFLQLLLFLGVVVGGISTYEAYDEGEIKKAVVGFVFLIVSVGALVGLSYS